MLMLALTAHAGAQSLEEDASQETCAPAPQLHGLWYDLAGEIQKAMQTEYRKDDIVIVVPAKSGTTWTMNIVHQLRSGGDPDVRDIYEQVHWIQFWDHPHQTIEEKINYINSQPTWFPRAFKSHAAIGSHNLEYNPDLRYIVVMRDPRDAAASFKPFIMAHNDDFINYWNVGPMMGPMKGMTADQIWGSPFSNSGKDFTDFLKGFWPHRNADNMLVMHFADMKKDHNGTIAKVAKFLDYDLPQSKFKKVCEYTSYKWMKAHGEKFSVQHLCKYPVLAKDGMVRNGAVGEGKTALSAETLENFEKLMDEELTPAQKEWMLHGGDEYLA